MRREGDETRSRGENSSGVAHRRHGVRHQPAGLDQARGLQDSGGADGMDGPSRFKSRAGAFVIDDAFIRRAYPADLLAVLQSTPPAASARSVGLQKTARAAA